MSNLNGKTAIVTGASKGIGAGIAKALAAAGASVVVNYASSKEGAEKVVKEITTKGGKAIAVHADTSKAADVKRLFDETKKAYGKLDVLVNNAGVYLFQPLEEITEDEFHRQYNINVLGTLLTTQQAVKHFGEKGGSVINISSVVSSNAMAGSSVYSSTKAAVDSITRILAVELGPKNVRVNSINPGLTQTEGTEKSQIIGSDMEKHTIGSTPLGRTGNPEDIALAAVFLASDDARWITGESIRVSGGLK
ncbi:MAG TPA: glucose 1-dehydrogenase [Alphaproteobacteria bacterium]|nr:glucose 1-dehydrogenase [Alphaproteobacteria bacterium]